MANLLNKYIWLADTIYKARKITFEEINRKWRDCEDFSYGEGLPLRTFHKWRIGIADMFGLDIECNRKAGYVYYIANEDEIREGGLKRWLFDTITESNLLMENKQLKDRILLDPAPANNEYLKDILHAMRNGHRLVITYHSYWRSSSSTFEVEPYCVKMFRRRWYLVARSPLYDKVMIYALDRIKWIELQPENHFNMPKDFCPEEFFEGSFGIISDSKIPIERVVLKVTRGQSNYMRDLPLHHSQCETRVDDDYSLFSYRLRPTFDFQQELLSLGADVEVISPEWLRQEVFEKIQLMYHQYEDLK